MARRVGSHFLKIRGAIRYPNLYREGRYLLSALCVGLGKALPPRSSGRVRATFCERTPQGVHPLRAWTNKVGEKTGASSSKDSGPSTYACCLSMLHRRPVALLG